ncbi:MAG: response regulator, partial [Myxococcales bacterium]|nr:response regulator [Myxococcales bacterium]
FKSAAFWLRGRWLPTFRYVCAGSPCGEVLLSGRMRHFRAVREAFPDDAFLREEGIESYSGSPVFDRAGSPLGVIGLLHDGELDVERASSLLERHILRVAAELEHLRTEIDLRRAQERLAFLTGHVPALLWTADRAGRLTFVSGRELQRVGVEPERLLGTTVGDSAHDAIWGLTAMDAHERAIEGQSLSYRERWRGEWYDVSVGPIRESDSQIVGTIGAALNATERVGEEARRASERERDRVLEQWESLSLMAGQIAHDFNNLLMGVMGNAGVALMRIPERHNARECVEQIEKAASRAAELTQQLMVCAGTVSMTTRACSVRSLADASVVRVRERLIGEYEVHVDAAEGLTVDVDPSQIETLLQNLLANAVQAIDQKGVVTLCANHLDVDSSVLARTLFENDCKPGSCVRLSVRDGGAGIPLGVRRRIFEPFFSTRAGHRGLGLSAVLGIARGHRAAIDIRDGDPGTIVDVYLSTESASDAERVVEASPSTDSTSPRVLVVDDEEMVRVVAELLLDGVGFAVESAPGGAEALEILRRGAPRVDVVLLDLTMPEMDGRQTFLAMREAGFETPVVLTSGYLESEVWGRFRADGVSGFIQKPYRVDDLVRVLRQAIGTP